ncbi:MAG: 5'/3'-nucleotidase SurE [Spirochaetes bacterium]|jgi:5'-nucleotidase|nr:5'/3'-nucleotidase SurE [Spirochaetota bacterium]
MRILLTNDDGIESPGLHAVREALEPHHETWILAPDRERSATSHCITIKDPIRCREMGERILATDGSPADCVILALAGVLPERPDVVISGINIGPNLGTDIIYSGTVAAARQAAIMGVPGIALSVDGFQGTLHFEPLAEFVRDRLEDLVELWNAEHFININAPNTPERDKRVEVTSPAVRMYHDKLSEFRTPRGDVYFFMGGYPADPELVPGTDWYAVHHGAISLTPVMINPVSHPSEEDYRRALYVDSTV